MVVYSLYDVSTPVSEILSPDQLEDFIAPYGAEFRSEMDQMIDLEESKGRKMNQPALLPMVSN